MKQEMKDLKSLVDKFRNAPGLMSLHELNILRESFMHLKELLEVYSVFREWEGVSVNFVESDIEKVNWYIDFNMEK